MLHHFGMRPILWLPFSCAVMLTLSGCANMSSPTSSAPSGTGPFDSQGNYHEEWANDPSKWRKPGSHSQPAAPSDELPVVATNEQPPPNASPFAALEAATPKPTASHPTPESRAKARRTAEAKTVTAKPKASGAPSTTHKTPAQVESEPPHSPAAKSKPATHAADKTPADKTPADKTPARKAAARKTAAHVETDPPKASSKTAAKAPTQGSRYTVKKGDNLYTIAEHHNSSVAEIRKANGLTETSLKPGKTLVIPK